ncbi:MAG TPA: RNA polymerase sigma factor [bacterium]|jgi:RNA polymerase sigma-70 factor (ECF subfamily)
MSEDKNQNEARIILRARDGDESALGELLDAHSNSLISYIYRLTGDFHQAEDLAQETFLRAFEHLSKFDIKKPFRPWLLKIGRNLTLNWLNSSGAKLQKRSEDLTKKYDLGTGTSPVEKYEKEERRQVVESVLDKLPVHFRDVLHLKYMEGLDYREISQELNLPPGTVKTWIHRAKKDFYRLAESSGIEFT